LWNSKSLKSYNLSIQNICSCKSLNITASSGDSSKTQQKSQILSIGINKEKASIFGHGSDIANKLKGSTPHDEQLIQISQSFSGLLLFAIGLVLFMVSFVKDREFHSFFAAGSVILYMVMALWRVMFEWKIEDLAFECPKQALGDIALAVSWVFFLVYTWREKYD